ncbi:MAG: hypothetical protein H6714_11755 [Myxococcales bacterium]|nr:hypothetical protein [Myxococcales bacterium]
MRRFRLLLNSSIIVYMLAGCDNGKPTHSGPDGSLDTSELDVLYDATDDNVADCSHGPLALPVPDCMPTPRLPTEDKAQDCVDRINQFRAQCQCLPPLERWTAGEPCANKQAEYDVTHGAHAGWKNADLCSSGAMAQNECPGFGSTEQVIGSCFQQMWDEGPGEPYLEHGHYRNMTDSEYTGVACGFFITTEGPVWAVQNFYK